MKPPVPGVEASVKLSGDTHSAFAVLWITWSREMPCPRSFCGSTCTCSCRSRWPQIATFATPGTPIRRGLIFQRASTDMSIRDTSLEDSPIIMTRPVDDSGCSMLGALDTFGMPPGAWTRRSCTSCRAFSTSVPGWKISSIRDSPGSDWERIWSRNATPLSRSCSSGTVTSCSTSSAESPSASVWMSTSGGLNSGRTSTGALRSWVMPSSISPAATGTTRSRNLRLDPMIQCIISEHRPVQRSLPNHLRSSGGRDPAIRRGRRALQGLWKLRERAAGGGRQFTRTSHTVARRDEVGKAPSPLKAPHGACPVQNCFKRRIG